MIIGSTWDDNWLNQRTETYKSVGMMTFPTYGKIKHVPNHQKMIEALPGCFGSDLLHNFLGVQLALQFIYISGCYVHVSCTILMGDDSGLTWFLAKNGGNHIFVLISLHF